MHKKEAKPYPYDKIILDTENTEFKHYWDWFSIVIRM